MQMRVIGEQRVEWRRVCLPVLRVLPACAGDQSLSMWSNTSGPELGLECGGRAHIEAHCQAL